ncbi:hypothetical protein DR64_3448 [Paraburkholderia xenovorans LB400]|nr:hypothetical protein [Paraburkholderia xenovorans]AIP33193.1 hypothetical protein DR64_3448 [Paraburkholderia xenovorans LB400]
MAIFAIIGQGDAGSEKLPGKIESAFPANFLKIRDNTWLVASKATVQEVSEQLGITKGESGAAVVLGVSTYFGRANPNIWSWIKEKWEATSG